MANKGEKEISLRLVVDDQGTARLVEFSDKAKSHLKKAEQAAEGLDKSFKRIDSTLRSLRTGVQAVSGAIAAMGLAAAAREIWQAGTNAEQLDRTFKAVFGSGQAVSAEMDFLRATAKALGQNFWELAASYKGIAAAGKTVGISGQDVRDVFVSVTKASSALGLSSEQTAGALRAIEQMMSKGKVQAEELRGQLGERLPGAFGLAARAMGVSTQKLDDMLKKGEVLATDLLPRLAKVLDKEFGQAALDAAGSAQAALNRFNEAWQDLTTEIAKSGLLQSMAESLKKVTETLKDQRVLDAAKSFGEYLGVMVVAASQLARVLAPLAKGLMLLSGLPMLAALAPTAQQLLEQRTQDLINQHQTGTVIAPGALESEYYKNSQKVADQDEFASFSLLQERLAAAEKERIAEAIKQAQKAAREKARLAEQSARLSAQAVETYYTTEQQFAKYRNDYFQKSLAARAKAEEKLSDRLAKLSMGETEYKIYQLDKQRKAYEDAEVDQTKIAKWYSAERARLEEGVLEKVLRSYSDYNKLIEYGTEGTLRAIQAGYAKTFGQVIRGEFDDLGDIARSVFDAILDAWINMLAQMAAAWTMQQFAGLFTSGGSATTAGGTASSGAGSAVGNIGSSIISSAIGKYLFSGGSSAATSIGSSQSLNFINGVGAYGGQVGSYIADSYYGYSGSMAAFNEGAGMTASEYAAEFAAAQAASSAGTAGGVAAAGTTYSAVNGMTATQAMNMLGSGSGAASGAAAGEAAGSAAGGASMAAVGGIAGMVAIAVMMGKAMMDESELRSSPEWNKLQLALTASREEKTGSRLGREYSINGVNSESGRYMGIEGSQGSLPTMQLLESYMGRSGLSEEELQAYVDSLSTVDALWLAQNDRIKKVDNSISALADELNSGTMADPIKATTDAMTEMAASLGLSAEQMQAWSEGIREGSLSLEDLQSQITQAGNDVVMGLGDMNQALIDLSTEMGLLGEKGVAYAEQSLPLVNSFLSGAIAAGDFNSSLLSLGADLGVSENGAALLADRIYFMADAIRTAGVNSSDLTSMLAALGLSASDVGDRLANKLSKSLLGTAGSAWLLTREARDAAGILSDDLASGLADVGEEAYQATQPIDALRAALEELPRDITTTVTTQYQTIGSAEHYHTGGIAGRGFAAAAMAANLISSGGGSAWPRFHDGGDVPAMLQSGEVIWSRPDISRWGGAARVNQMRKEGPAGGSGGHTFQFTVYFSGSSEDPRRQASQMADAIWQEFDRRYRNGRELGKGF